MIYSYLLAQSRHPCCNTYCLCSSYFFWKVFTSASCPISHCSSIFGSLCMRFSSKLFCLLLIVYLEAPPRGRAIRTESILIVLDTSVHINENQ